MRGRAQRAELRSFESLKIARVVQQPARSVNDKGRLDFEAALGSFSNSPDWT